MPDETPARVVARTGREHYRTDVVAGGHTVLVDEPVADGGTDQGPTPYDLLAAALGGCTTITLRMYADRKGWPLEEVVVRVRHSKVYAEDDACCEESDQARIDLLERDVVLGGPLSEEQRARLLTIADRCPVHRTLSAGLRVRTRLVEAHERPAPSA